MYNIKIKSVPDKAKTGSQLDYSLVDRNTLFLKPDTQVQSDVKNTISKVPRDEANIEAEGGETIIGDTNNDGFLEHQTIVGKRHSQGGVPLNVPEGSFIFSDTDKLRIKDPEILKMFGMSPNKKGYTPAEIAKKYQVNAYIAILKDETKDKYSKETAQVMLDSNLKKLGMLALVQESMKGFPDGVPAIAESVMAGMMGGGAPEQQEEEQQGQPEARYGGTQLPKAQEGKDYSLWGDIKRSASDTVEAMQKEGFVNYMQNWWDKYDENFKKTHPTQKVSKKVIAKKKEEGPSFMDNYFSIGKAQQEAGKQGSIAIDNWQKKREEQRRKEQAREKEIERLEKEYEMRKEWEPIRQQKIKQDKSVIKQKGDIYINNKPNSIINQAKGFWGDEWVTFRNPITVTNKNGKKESITEMKLQDWQSLKKNKSLKVGYEDNFITPNSYTNINNLTNYNQDHFLHSLNPNNWDEGVAYNTLTYSTTPGVVDTKSKVAQLQPGYEYKYGNKKYKVINSDVYDPYNKSTSLTGREAVKVREMEDPDMDWNAFTSFGDKIILKDDYLKMFNVNSVSGNNTHKISGKEEEKDAVGNTISVNNTENNNGKPKPEIPIVKKSRVQEAPVNTNTSTSPFVIDTSEEEQRYGGSIYKMQVGGTPRFNSATGMYQNYDANGKPVGAPYKLGTTYNVRDKELLDKGKAAEYEIISNKYAPNISYIPEQTSKTGFAPGVESGIYENKQFPIGKQGLDELVNIWKDELSNYEGPSGKGVEAWKTDILKAKGKPSAASKFYVLEANKSSNAAGLGDQIDTNVEDWDVPGQEWFSTKKFKKAAPAQVAQAVNTPSIQRGAPEIMQQAITPTIGRKTRGWFTPDMLNLANAFGRRIGNFPPTLQQVALESGPYNLLSPEGEIAKIQSTGNMLSNQAANTMAGNVGFNAAVGAQGQTIDAVTNTQGRYSNANVGTSNEASRFGSGVFNQGQLTNTQLLSAFDRDRAIYGQQRLDALNRKDDTMTRAYNQAWGNAFKANVLEDMFPQVGIDRVFGDIGWSGEGKDYHEYDPYINPFIAAQAMNMRGRGRFNMNDVDPNQSMEQYMKAYNAALPTMGKENAQKFALQHVNRNSRNDMFDPYNPYNPAQGVAQGLSNMGWGDEPF